MSVSVRSIGWIGTGVMGAHMAKHASVRGGYSVHVYNRTKSTSDSVAKTINEANLAAKASSRAVVSTSIAEMAKQRPTDGICLMVGYPQDVETVVLGPNGLLNNMSRGDLLIDLTTSRPTLAKEIYTKCAEKGVICVDAPVSGGDVGAKEGNLTIMVGAETQEDFDRASKILSQFGKPRWMGKPGAGQFTKMANQITIAGSMIGVVEGLLFAHSCGLDLEQYVECISGGGAASKSLSLYAPRILVGNMEPGFYVKHFVKDLGIALDEATKLKLALPGLALANQLYLSLTAHGEGDLGTQAIIKALARLSNVQGGAWMKQ